MNVLKDSALLCSANRDRLREKSGVAALC
jgi:hypothetical protein